jgi:large subunit ribosomal protein L29
MRPKEIRDRSPDELAKLEQRLTRELFQLRFQNFTNRLDDTGKIRKTRRDLARVKTILRERATAPAPAAAAEKDEP